MQSITLTLAPLVIACKRQLIQVRNTNNDIHVNAGLVQLHIQLIVRFNGLACILTGMIQQIIELIVRSATIFLV
jgi:hypothetical protein